MPSPGFRKLTITLTIVVIVAHPTCGFTLNRKTTAEADPGPTTDLASQESLQVKYVKSPNDIKQGKDADMNKATKSKYRFSGELKFIDSTEDTAVDIKETETTQDSSVADITTTQEPEVIRTSASVSETTAQGIKPTISANTASSENTANSSSESLENVTANLPNNKSTHYSEISSTTSLENKSIKSELARTKFDNITLMVAMNRRESEVKSTTNLPTINDQIAIDSETTENLTAQNDSNTILRTEFDNITASKVAENSMESEVKSIKDVPTIDYQKAIDSETLENLSSQKNSNLTTEHFTETSNTDIGSETNYMNTKSTKFLASSEIYEKPNITSSESITNILSSKADSTTSQSAKPESSLFPDETSISASTIVELKVTKDTSTITTEPTREKYTMIERKRILNSEETSSRTEKDKDSVKAESIQTTLPIPSLEMLREDLLSNANQFSTARETQIGSEALETTMMPTIESIESIQSETLGTVASKRAGFLDLSKRTSTNNEDTTTDINNEYRTIYQVEATDIESQEIKKEMESRSQLAEDAIKEELLKEEIISNHEENANRYEDGEGGVKPHADKAKNVESTITEDTLSVQPINQARRTTLYTVGPNYKPMKRIEVQPAKPFVRDPDDNSWRNESISSLGIVFKPKTSSSKSFKEVLKTKTETEFNNLQDKDNKDDTPELRERLEKITEVRKKKKKIDKFGEVVYTDYEEGSSAEGTSNPKAETTPTEVSSSEKPSTLSSTVPEVEVTSPMTTTENQRYWKNKLETISKEEMFKELGLDILTTEKTKKPYNLAEYYDTTDEYDADYVTQTKIDLKKFTVPLKTTFPSLTSPAMSPPTTRFKAPRFPERKPTVQYFPPTTKPQKVNVNDYDVDFERRVQLYTLKETQTPKTILPDVASMPEATDRPRIRPTVKTSDFTMITPQFPDNLSKHVFMSDEPRVTDPHNFVISNGNLNRGTYVIKHFRDFLNEAAKEEDDVRSPDFVPYTEPPARGVTLDEMARATDIGTTTEADYEYDNQFRKEVLSRFVDNFNQNSDRFKVDFPVLFNSSVIHRSNDDQGRLLASSSTFMKRLYGNELTATRPPKSPSNFLMNKGCENCDNITVELSPAYELHYYVPEQEEKQEMEQRPAAQPYRYNL